MLKMIERKQKKNRGVSTVGGLLAASLLMGCAAPKTTLQLTPKPYDDEEAAQILVREEGVNIFCPNKGLFGRARCNITSEMAVTNPSENEVTVRVVVAETNKASKPVLLRVGSLAAEPVPLESEGIDGGQLATLTLPPGDTVIYTTVPHAFVAGTTKKRAVPLNLATSRWDYEGARMIDVEYPAKLKLHAPTCPEPAVEGPGHTRWETDQRIGCDGTLSKKNR